MKVNEIFGPTLQGEGRSIGMRTMFLRLAGCNLSCCWCDTKYSWDWNNYDPDKEIKIMTCEEIIRELIRLSPEVRKLVISGGEPMLQQRELITLLNLLKYESYWVEIETNGTVMPKDIFLEKIDQINCSPKTKNSGISRPDREKIPVLVKLAQSTKTNFKFVLESEGDLPEIEEFILTYGITRNRIYLMPQAQTKEEYFGLVDFGGLEISRDVMVQILAHRQGLNYTPRLHISYYNNQRGH